MSTTHSFESNFLAIASGGDLAKTEEQLSILSESLIRAATQTEKLLFHVNSYGKVISQPYAQLLQESARCLTGLREKGVKPGDRVMIILEASQDILTSFWGCILGGYIPIILEAPPKIERQNRALETIKHIDKLLDNPLVIISTSRIDIQKMMANNHRFVYIENLLNNQPTSSYHSATPEEIALLSLTSGSTSQPKCIPLTHRNLITRSLGTNILNQHTDGETMLNWLPLTHIGSISDWHIRPVLLGCQSIYVAKEYILGNILHWLDLIANYRVTQTWAPNFAYALLNNQLKQSPSGRWDLSCLKYLLNAGEMISYKIYKDCLVELQKYGLKEEALRTGFGMAEFGSGITYSQIDKSTPIYHLVDLEKQEKITENSGNKQSLFVDLGVPIPGIELRIVNENQQILPAGKIGYLQVKGDCVFVGYYNQSDKLEATFTKDNWFTTQDLGFLTNNHLVLTGRNSGIIIINGVNYYSHEIETIVEEIENVIISCTAACGIIDLEQGTEKLAIFFSSNLEFGEELLAIIKQIRNRIISNFGISPDYIIPLDKNDIPKTSIGKIQRQKLIDKFQEGKYNQIRKKIEQQYSNPKSLQKVELEQELLKIWQNILDSENIRLEDNFFELGGSSLLLVQIQQKIQDQLGFNLSITDLFRYPSISALAKNLQKPETEIIKTQSQRPIKYEEIAIIGMACRFPGAKDIDTFWQNLCQGVESISFFTEAEILATGINPELVKNKQYVKARPIIDHGEDFDAEFFGYNPKEAELLDPQQRVLLECVWESLEDAGYSNQDYKGVIGLYAGTAMNTYLLNQIYPNRQKFDPQDSLEIMTLDSLAGFQIMVANDKDYLPTRISYKLNLTGPSVNVQTACSTSLTAVHQAIQSIQDGSCDLAIAGGVSIQIPQKIGYLYQDGLIVSPDGHCRAFDAKAQGTVFGNGVGVVVLKPLTKAVADKDHIYGVIKSSAMVNDGGNKVNFLAPNGEGQSRAVTQAIAIAQIPADSISYLEAHGTGTILGDPIEVEGLSRAFRLTTNQKQFCALGSVKTNIGHLQIASGIAGLIKTTLSLYHRKIPPSLHFEQPNPQIDWSNSPFYVNNRLQYWDSPDSPRRAGVNSLGIGGTNVHVILEEFIPVKDIPQAKERPLHIFTISAQNQEAWYELRQKYQDFLEKNPTVNIGDLCFSVNTGRNHLRYRGALVTSSTAQLATQLAQLSPQDCQKNKISKIAFIFSTQQRESIYLAKQLYETQATFKQSLDSCLEIIEANLGYNLLTTPSPLHNHLLILAIDYALYKLWQSWGIQPTAVIGDSLGEYLAACVAGVLTLEDSIKLIIIETGKISTENFTQILSTIELNSPEIDIISSCTGNRVNQTITSVEYWCDRLNQPLQYQKGIEYLTTELGYNTFIECGLGSQINTNNSALEQLFHNLTQLYYQNIPIDWQEFHRDYSYQRLRLPTYPFQRQRYFIERQQPAITPLTLDNFTHPLLGQQINSPLETKIFQSSLSLETKTWLQEHKIHQQPIIPGAVYLETALAGILLLTKSDTITLTNIKIQKALDFSLNSSLTLQTIIEPQNRNSSWKIYSFNSREKTWELNSQGNYHPVNLSLQKINLQAIKAQFTTQTDVNLFYQNCQNRGLNYGESFKNITELWVEKGTALAKITLTQNNQYYLHPQLLDSCLQTTIATFGLTETNSYVPVAIDKFSFYGGVETTLWSYVKRKEKLVTDVILFTEKGDIVAKIEGLKSQEFKGQKPDLYQIEWQSKPNLNNLSTKLGKFLIITDREKQGEELAQILQCSVILPKENLIEPSVQGIIYFSNNSNNLEETVAENCQNILNLVQQLLQQKRKVLPRLWLITEQTQGEIATIATVGQSPLWGMGKTINREYPEFNCVCIDIDSPSPETIKLIAAEILKPDQETQIVFRDHKRYVARLVPSFATLPKNLHISQRGTIESLNWRSLPRQQPQPDEVEIRVKATGLNFRDLLNVLDIYPPQPFPLGLECVGEVVTLGKQVNQFQIGDEVFGLALGAFSEYVNVPAAWLAIKPETVNSIEAATIPGAFLTAYYTLIHLAKLKAKERVLIHAAAGGVGLAAVQISLSVGAEVFATASPQKWDTLKSLGVKWVMNSRQPNFSTEIQQITHGVGVDVVLNCLKEDFIKESLTVLKPQGRFLEIGKQGIWTESQIKAAKPDVSYFCPDLLTLAQSQPELLQSIWQNLVERFQSRQLQPLPYQLFPRQKIKEAFRTLQQAKHIGKIVIAQKESHQQNSQKIVNPQGSYLITGGFGDLGLKIAQWLGEKGTKYLILLGRNQPSATARAIIEKLRKKQISILLCIKDVSQPEAVAELFNTYQDQGFPPIKGIIHAAGVLEDSTITQLSQEKLTRVIAPKIKGAWYLHQFSQQEELDFFVLFSSIASLLGSAGQINYSAANSFLDSLAQARQAMNLPGLSINWGPFAEIGMAARQEKYHPQLEMMERIIPEQGLAILEQLLFTDVSNLTVASINWENLLRTFDSPFLEVFRQENTPKQERPRQLVNQIILEITKVLGLEDLDLIDLNEDFASLGMDSLSSIELKNRLETSLGISLPATLIYDYPTINSLKAYLDQKLAKNPQSAPEIAAIQALSDTEAALLLTAELKKIQQDVNGEVL